MNDIKFSCNFVVFINYIKLAFPIKNLDLDLMNLILKLNLDIAKMYPHTKNEVSRSNSYSLN